jgi:catechol 2,3-dioxygenase-like lactoylglutathione lyase family enzyme
VHFYKDILKFRVTFAKDDWFRELAVNAGARISVADAKRCTIPAGHGAGMTLSWHVDELVELHAYLKEQKVRVTDITQHSWRAPYFYAFDPDGHRIEFWK